MKRDGHWFHIPWLAVVLFVVLGGLLLLFARFYETREARELLSRLHAKEVAEIKAKAEAFIDEKRHATLAIALALSHDADIREQLQTGQVNGTRLERLSHSFRDHSHYRNLWIRLQDAKGKTLAQSWPAKPEDALTDKPPLANQPDCEIRLDSENLGLHASSPIRNQQGGLLGRLVVISHFNSLASHLQELGYESLVLVQPEYRAQLTHPVSQTFIEDHYVANHHPNQKLLKLARDKGLKNLISPDADFVIEPEQGLLVVKLSLFDRAQRPLANILMFRPVAELQNEVMQQLGVRVQLMSALGLCLLAFVLHLFSNRHRLLPSVHPASRYLPFVGIFLALTLLQVGLLNWIGEQRRHEYLESLNKDIKQHFNYIKNKYQNMAEVVFQTSINRPEILNIMAEAQHDPANSRRRLMEYLVLEYEHFFRKQLRQLHFHTRTNQSFLRFHRPGKYGDDLSQFRPTVRWVNQQQQGIHGFENDPMFSGFRSVFPLIYKDAEGKRAHLGSVEIAFGAFGFAKELAQHQNDRMGFLIPASEVERLASRESQNNFIPSPIPGFFLQEETHSQLKHAGTEADFSALENLDAIAREIHKGRIFSRGDRNLRQIYSFLPLENPVTKELAAVLVLQSQDGFLAERTNYFRMLLAMGILGALFISLFSWRSHEDKVHIQALLAKTQSILDAQNAIIVISDGIHLLDFNRQLLDFFGVPSGEILRTRYACICEAFIQDDKFFHLGKVPPGVGWLEYLEQLPKREHIVSMRDTSGRPQAFALALSRFENLYIISFSNISDTMREHFDLAERVVRDKLTGAYNREFFAKHIQELIQDAASNKLILGCILFDIDHFKQVNDSYGHARGDLVLIRIVQLANRSLRQEDLLIRWGGEEFLILVRVPSIEQLVRVAENLRAHVEADSHPEVGKVTCSFGISLYQYPEPVEQSLERADQALYRAKALGRNRVEVEI